ncbi:MAG: hypothetical protein CL912_15085 [Deltaproteobacteria bacterium]|nr:hypothetical protein [Deltaproteobacteria bacterium]
MVLGLSVDGFKFDAINISFHEIVVKGSLHASVEAMEKMFLMVKEHGIRSQITTVKMEEAENLPERAEKRRYKGNMIVMI